MLVQSHGEADSAVCLRPARLRPRRPGRCSRAPGHASRSGNAAGVVRRQTQIRPPSDLYGLRLPCPVWHPHVDSRHLGFSVSGTKSLLLRPLPMRFVSSCDESQWQASEPHRDASGQRHGHLGLLSVTGPRVSHPTDLASNSFSGVSPVGPWQGRSVASSAQTDAAALQTVAARPASCPPPPSRRRRLVHLSQGTSGGGTRLAPFGGDLSPAAWSLNSKQGTRVQPSTQATVTVPLSLVPAPALRATSACETACSHMARVCLLQWPLQAFRLSSLLEASF